MSMHMHFCMLTTLDRRIQDLQERLARYEGQGFTLGPTLCK